MTNQSLDLSRSITKKQTVAVTGLLLILFVIVHLAGNLLIYAGPKAFNGYAEKLEHLGVLKTIAEWSLFFLFLLHVERVTSLIVQNIRAAGGLKRYAVNNSRGPRSLAARLMPVSGFYLVAYLIWHLYDFTWANHEGARNIIQGQNMELYGLVVNAFKNPLHAWLYVGAMFFLSLHLAHGVQSFIQTFGFNENRLTLAIKNLSRSIALLIAMAYSSIPLYVLYFLKV